MLDTLHPTMTGQDGIRSTFLKVGTPFFARPIANMINLAISSVFHMQWKATSISLIQISQTSLQPSVYRPMSITPVLSRHMEHFIVGGFKNPSFQCQTPGLDFSDQFVFQPTGSTTASLVELIHTITTLQESNRHCLRNRQKCLIRFDLVNSLKNTTNKLNIHDFVYNGHISFYQDHTHCSKFSNAVSDFLHVYWPVLPRDQ